MAEGFGKTASVKRMHGLYQEVMRRLEADKKNYKFIFYCPKRDALLSAKSVFTLRNGKRRTKMIDYTDGEIYGHHIVASHTGSWEYLGKL